jgi:hypothetical protein
MRKVAISLLFSTGFSAYGQDWSAVQQKLASEYAVTQPTAALDDIVTAGAVLVLKKGNVVMVPVNSTNLFQNAYKEGKLTQNTAYKAEKARKIWKNIPIVGNSAPDGVATRAFATGEKMFVTKIDVNDGGVTFSLFTDSYKDASGADVRYKADLKFQFPKGFTPTTDQVDKVVAEVFKVQTDDKNADAKPQPQQQSTPANPQPATQTNLAEAVPPPIPPPPPPPADPKKISLGQTPDQVVATFGQPARIAKLGPKQIYTYPDMKVTFVNAKVTDVQ